MLAVRKIVFLPRDMAHDAVGYVHMKTTSVSRCTTNYVLDTLLSARDKMILICIALLEAIDCIQARLKLSLAVVRRIKRKLIRVLEKSWDDDLQMHPETHVNTDELTNKIAQAETWAKATTDDIIGFVTWITSAIDWVRAVFVSGITGVCRQALVLIGYAPGVSKTRDIFHQMYTMLDTLVNSDEEDMMSDLGSPTSSVRTHSFLNSLEDEHLTALVLSYRERDFEPANLPGNLSHRIRRMMHFQVSLRPFEATVVVPDSTEAPQSWRSQNTQIAITPHSIPASPLARIRVQNAFNHFSDDVLYQARDQLRRERAETLTGAPQPAAPTFDPQDSHQDIILSCGLHCASKVGTGLYRSCRATLPIRPNRSVYFQMSIITSSSPINDVSDGEGQHNGICIGLATKDMPLNTLVGTWKQSIGFYSSGHIIAGSQWRNYVSVESSFDGGNTVGVLVYIDEEDRIRTDEGESIGAKVQFLIDGRPLYDKAKNPIVASVRFDPRAQVYPTITLYANDTKVLSRFSSSDIIVPHIGQIMSPGHDIWCLDDTKLQR